MTYSDSTHFSDKFSYKILCISSYRLKDTNFARYAHLQQYSENREIGQDFSHRKRFQPESLTGGARGS
jgi:hypothetical protein